MEARVIIRTGDEPDVGGGGWGARENLEAPGSDAIMQLRNRAEQSSG